MRKPFIYADCYLKDSSPRLALNLVPEGQPIAGAGNLLAKENQKIPFKIENISCKDADDNQSHPECCFVIHVAYWPALDRRTSLVSNYGELRQQRFDLGYDVFGSDTEVRIKLVDRGRGTEALHPNKRGLLRIATLAS